jgi:thiamine pyrophosphate-dependent acetolactate synthase large subunit-like protein
MSMADPQPNLGMLARSMGLVAPEEQVTDPTKLEATLAWAVKQVMDEGKSVLVDVRVRPDGYGSAP